MKIALITNTSCKDSLLCTPAGVECHLFIKKQEGKCLTPCKGVFADVQKNTFEYDLNTIEDYRNIVDEIRDLLDILGSSERLRSVVGDELLEVKNEYGDDRRTEIVENQLDL